jgi:hypothetical protein
MMTTPSGHDELEKRLTAVEGKLSEHPLSSDTVREAFAVIEKHGKENRGAISQELRERGLPTLDALGKIQARTSLAWWKLHRDRRSLLKKLGREERT